MSETENPIATDVDPATLTEWAEPMEPQPHRPTEPQPNRYGGSWIWEPGEGRLAKWGAGEDPSVLIAEACPRKVGDVLPFAPKCKLCDGPSTHWNRNPTDLDEVEAVCEDCEHAADVGPIHSVSRTISAITAEQRDGKWCWVYRLELANE